MEKVNELNDVRKLATIAVVKDIQPIVGADNIEKIFIRGWQCVAKKNEFHIGDLCVYVEVDSIMPDGLAPEKAEEWRELNKQMSRVETEDERNQLREKMTEISKLNTRPEFEFLRPIKFHIKTRKILGEISQGICFPVTILPKALWNDEEWLVKKILQEGTDVTELLGVTQLIAPDPATLGGNAKGFLTNVGLLVTDEERIENLSGKYDLLRNFTYYKTEKLDGTSFTAYLKKGVFGVCGRTMDFQVPEEGIGYDEMNSYWKTAIKLDIEKKMRQYAEEMSIGDSFAIQGEMVGEGIQKNIYKLKGQTVCFYNAFNIDTQEYIHYDAFIEMIKLMGLQTVPILNDNYTLPENAIDLLLEADVTTTVFGNNPKQLIEGFVYVAKGNIFDTNLKVVRATYNRISFKAKSRTFDMNKNK